MWSPRVMMVSSGPPDSHHRKLECTREDSQHLVQVHSIRFSNLASFKQFLGSPSIDSLSADSCPRTCSHVEVLAVKLQKVVFAVKQDLLYQFSNRFCPTWVLEQTLCGELCAPSTTALPLSSLKSGPQGSVSKAAVEVPFDPAYGHAWGVSPFPRFDMECMLINPPARPHLEGGVPVSCTAAAGQRVSSITTRVDGGCHNHGSIFCTIL